MGKGNSGKPTSGGSTGTSGADLIQGTARNDLLSGYEGNDTIFGGDGNDTISGGAGNDSISGNAGDDYFSIYENGSDTIDGGTGTDFVGLSFTNSTGTITYTAYNPLTNSGTITDGAGRSLTYTNIERFRLEGWVGNDDLRGSSGDDYLYGDSGNDTLFGSTGNDLLDGGNGNSWLDGGDGNDTIIGRGKDTIFGGNGDDFVNASFQGNIDGGAGSDTLQLGYVGLTSSITYIAFDPTTGSGAIADGAGNSTTYSSIEKFKLIGGEGNDDLRGASGNDTLSGHTGKDTLTGNAGNDDLAGYYGNDLIKGGDGNDTLAGGRSTKVGEIDTLTGGAGSDRFNLGGLNVDGLFINNSYNDNNSSTSGLGDYGLITDFNPTEDTIALSASVDPSIIPSASLYILGSSPIAGVSGTAIYQNTDGQAGLGSTDELLAVLQGANNLSLTASYFTYVVDRSAGGG